MTHIIEKLITQVNIGEPHSFQRLKMFPLTGVEEQSIDYLKPLNPAIILIHKEAPQGAKLDTKTILLIPSLSTKLYTMDLSHGN